MNYNIVYYVGCTLLYSKVLKMHLNPLSFDDNYLRSYAVRSLNRHSNHKTFQSGNRHSNHKTLQSGNRHSNQDKTKQSQDIAIRLRHN